MSTKLLLHFYQQPGKTSHQWKYIVSDISDHFSQVCITSYKKTLCKSARLYSSFSAENFNKVLAEVDWDRMVANGNDNVNNLFSSFYNNFNKIVNKLAPIKKLSNRKAKQLSKPWITSGIRASISIKNKLYASGDDRKYRFYRNKICNLIRLSN